MNKWEKYDPTKDYPDDIYWIMLEGETEARKSHREYGKFTIAGMGSSPYNDAYVTHVMLYGDEHKPEPPVDNDTAPHLFGMSVRTSELIVGDPTPSIVSAVGEENIIKLINISEPKQFDIDYMLSASSLPPTPGHCKKPWLRKKKGRS